MFIRVDVILLQNSLTCLVDFTDFIRWVHDLICYLFIIINFIFNIKKWKKQLSVAILSKSKKTLYNFIKNKVKKVCRPANWSIYLRTLRTEYNLIKKKVNLFYEQDLYNFY